ncbi:MAG: hypothetical protein M1818_001573 [Claussenomyces sp. TS43310]|nr:MAG: hypothetical protein M1818_001573 [Claussenomyces sp. TS43310]
MAASSSAASLSASVTSLRSSLALLDSSITILDAGVSDFPRLSTVLTATRHFELTPASALTAAQASLASELAPTITALVARVDAHCAKLERREQALIAKSELQEGRLGGSGSAGDSARKNSLSVPRSGPAGAAGVGGNAARLKALRQKKERLNYAVERLSLQSQQRQRQLRMSVNVPRVDD